MARGRKPSGPTLPPPQSRFHFMGDSNGQEFKWDDTSPEILGEAVLGALKLECALMFSLTSDGGAVRVTIYDGDAKHSKYCKDSADLEQVCKQVRETSE